MPLAFFLPAAFRLANPAIAGLIDKLVGGLAVVLAILGIYLAIHHAGEKAGAAKVEAKVEKAHSVAVAQARDDTATAANASAAIATSVAQKTVASEAVTHYIIEDLNHAIDAVPPAAPGAALPAAPVDRVRDDLNTRVADARRAADAADALP